MASTPLANLRLTHLKLENWRNFSRAEADLARRVFVVGPNASGKSNFLDALRFLHDIVAVGGGLEHAVRKRGGVKPIRCLAARRYPEVAITVRIGNDEEPALWEYEVSFNQDQQRRLRIQQERVTAKGRTLLDRPNKADREDPARLTQTYLEQIQANKPFRPVADFFKAINYLHVIPQIVREPDRFMGRQDDPYGGDFLEQIAGTNKRTQAARLRRIQRALRVAVPQLHSLEPYRDERGHPHLRGKYEHWRPEGAWQDEAQFSDGTLRLMGLLWAVLEARGPLLLEEPELSLHPDVVRFIPEMLARVQRKSTYRKQILLSTHSSDLLRGGGIGIDEVLLLMPSSEGTEVRPASDFREIPVLLEQGLSMAEAVMPKTRPARAHQLPLFPDE